MERGITLDIEPTVVENGYKIGKAWAAVIDGKIVKAIKMGDFEHPDQREVMQDCNKKRLCLSVIRQKEELQKTLFSNHREESLQRLAEIPNAEIYSGTIAQRKFVIGAHIPSYFIRKKPCTSSQNLGESRKRFEI